MSEARYARRRRSAARTPALVDPADIPDDAAGRVSVVVVRAPDDVLAVPLPPPPPGEEALRPPAPDESVAARGLIDQLVTARGGWLAVVVLGLVLLLVFIIGMVVTR